jgi:D-3-phosphoglycerate dehydrogenase
LQFSTITRTPCASCPAFALLEGHDVKVFNNTVKGVGQLAARLGCRGIGADSRAHRVTRQLLEKLPKLRIISQTGRAGNHVDIEACTERGVVVLEGVGSPVAPAELTWALIMAAQRRIPSTLPASSTAPGSSRA